MAQAPPQYKGLRVEERPRLLALHNGGELTFLYPAYGPGTYANVGLSIVQDGLRKPTMAETASLVHAVSNSDDKYSQEIKGIMRHSWLLASTGNLYIPEKGVFIQDNPEIINGTLFMDRNSLEQKINAKDPNVRYVQFGYPVGEMSPSDLAKNTYVIGVAGEEGAEQLARIAGNFNVNPQLFSYESVDKNETRISALGFRDSEGGLGVIGYHPITIRAGYAFGLSEKVGIVSRTGK